MGTNGDILVRPLEWQCLTRRGDRHLTSFLDLSGMVSSVQSLMSPWPVVTAFYTGIIFSIGIYRLFFHRLLSFPGPLVAKLTRFYTVKKAFKTVQLV